jgi:cysteine desulfurase family protein (TIGR01976 family)
MLDVEAVRARFPSLTRTDEHGRPYVFADAPGGSQVTQGVIDAIGEHLRQGTSNTHGAFLTSRETDELIEVARRSAADLVGADPGEIVFGPNATTLLMGVARSFGRTLEPGDEVVLTRLDHDANVRPWLLAAEDAGATVRWVDVCEDDATLDVDSFDAALSERTRLVAFTLASNAVGSIPHAAELVRRAKAAGALVAVDGVHLAQHRALDLHRLGADIQACSPYKIFGPHLGIVAVRRELLETWRPYKVRPATDEPPASWETGTQNHEGLAGFAAAVEHVRWLGRTFTAEGEVAGGDPRAEVLAGYGAIAEHERTLSLRFLDGLGSLPRVRLWGIADPSRVDERTPTFAVRLGDAHPLATSEALGDRGIFTWDGHYYAIELFERLGLLEDGGGAVRIGFCHYSTEAEVDRVLEALADLGRV